MRTATPSSSASIGAVRFHFASPPADLLPALAGLVVSIGCGASGNADPMTGAGGSTMGGNGGSSMTSSGGSVTGSSSGGTSDVGGTTNSGGSGATAGNQAGGSGGTSGEQDGVIVDGTCRPLCADASTDPDGDGWGWEFETSCVVPDAPVAMGRMACNAADPIASGGTAGMGGNASGAGGSAPATGGSGQGTGGNGQTGGSSGAGSGGTSSGGCGSGGPAQSCPASFSCPDGSDPNRENPAPACGCYEQSGLGPNKQALVAAGADQTMIASAMMETDQMDATLYVDGDGKDGDAWNGGVTKQNWYMMRNCHAAWSNEAASACQSGGGSCPARAMNTDRALDVQVYGECRAEYGDLWWAGHRNGQTGLMNPNTDDITRFKLAHEWTEQMLDCHLTDDVRFWVDVPAIVLR